MDEATHHAFVTEVAWLDDVTQALGAFARGDETSLDPALKRWWKAREERLERSRVALDDAERRALASAAPEVLAAPSVVRPDALDRVRTLVPRITALVRIHAPPIVLSEQRRLLAAAIDALDPARPFVPAPAPDVARDEADQPLLDVWIDTLLRAAVALRVDVGLGRLHELPPAPPRAAWPGPTTFAHAPDDAALDPPSLRLPRELTVRGLCVVAASSGPITAAAHGDVIGAPADGRLVRLVHGLAPDEALVSFVWRTTEPAGPFSAL